MAGKTAGKKARAGGVKVKAFGQLLKQLRADALGKRSSLDQVVGFLANEGHALSKTTLSRNEKHGLVPDVAALHWLAPLYDVKRERLIDALMVAIANPAVNVHDLLTIARDPVGHTDAVQVPLPSHGEGGAYGQTSTRLQLDPEIVSSVFDQVRKDAVELINTAEGLITGRKVETAQGKTSRRRKDDRGRGRRSA